jgi:peptidoglycan hydrolase-like protein with peptidoglycan-binding domain
MLRSRAHGKTVAGVMRTSKLLAGGTPTTSHPIPHTVAPAWPGRVLALTSPLVHGNDVAAWQNQMRARGWKAINVDGVYGPVSAKVCSQFQAEKHIAVDGNVGPVTWRAAWTAGK